MDSLAVAVGWAGLVAGILLILMGAWMMWIRRNQEIPRPDPATLTEQGGPQKIIDSATDLAKALKDLDRGSRLMVVGVLLVGFAALVAGVGEVADAVSEIASSISSSQ